jgi:hypothetical protein
MTVVQMSDISSNIEDARPNRGIWDVCFRSKTPEPVVAGVAPAVLLSLDCRRKHDRLNVDPTMMHKLKEVEILSD